MEKNQEFYKGIQIPRTSQEFKKRLSLTNDEKSIELVDFNIKDTNKYNSIVFKYSIPRTSQEFQMRISL